MADRESVEDFTIHSEGGFVFPSFEGQRILDIRNSQRNGSEDAFFVFQLNKSLSDGLAEGVIMLTFWPYDWFDGGSPPYNSVEYVSALRLDATGSISEEVIPPGGSGKGVVTDVSAVMDLTYNERTWYYFYYIFDVFDSGTAGRVFILEAFAEIEGFVVSVTLVGSDLVDLKSYLTYSAASIELP